jgi:hypothetical protein
MIENKRQYEVAKQQAARLEAGLAKLLEGRPERRITDPLLEETALAGVRHILDSLHDEILDYESRVRGAPDGDHPRTAKSPHRRGIA